MAFSYIPFTVVRLVSRSVNLRDLFSETSSLKKLQGLEYTVQLSRFCDGSAIPAKPNGEEGIRTLAPLLTTYSLSRGAPSAKLGYFSMLCLNETLLYIIYHLPLLFAKLPSARRGWDSNPRALADKRFSRPPRYDHFDTSPKVCSNILLH